MRKYSFSLVTLFRFSQHVLGLNVTKKRKKKEAMCHNHRARNGNILDKY